MLTKKGNALHKKGSPFPNRGGNGEKRVDYAAMVSAALRKEFGHARGATKTVMQWTGASERTVKNWFAGTEGPTSEHLIGLVRHSDSVLAGLLQICGRAPSISLDRLDKVRGMLLEAALSLERVAQDPMS